MSRLDVEWVAFRAGLKPALRLSARPSEAAVMAARFRAAGAAVVEARGWFKTAAERRVLLYVARAHDAADAVREAEAPTLQGEAVCPQERSIQCALRVGELLGYPHCCVAAFCARMERGVGRLADGHLAAELYVAAAEAWRARSSPWLNNLRRPEHLELVSFEPCAYDCPAALEWAGRCCAALRASDPVDAHELELALSQPVAIAPSGARALVELRQGRIVRATAPRRDRPPSCDDEALARALFAATVDATGRVAAGEGSPVVVCNFAGASKP
jgi:hypothetical protein